MRRPALAQTSALASPLGGIVTIAAGRCRQSQNRCGGGAQVRTEYFMVLILLPTGLGRQVYRRRLCRPGTALRRRRRHAHTAAMAAASNPTASIHGHAPCWYTQPDNVR